MSRKPQPLSTWLLASIAAYLFVLNAGMLILAYGSFDVFELTMAILTLGVGAALASVAEPWLLLGRGNRKRP